MLGYELMDNILFTVTFTDEDQELGDRHASSLMRELRDLDEVEEVSRVKDPNPPAGNMSAFGFLTGMLVAEATAENGKKLLVFLGDRLGNKAIKLKVEGNGKSLEVEASSKEELQFVIAEAQKFLES
jgi:hypothetical protein